VIVLQRVEEHQPPLADPQQRTGPGDDASVIESGVAGIE
jgi:hypothetical protein